VSIHKKNSEGENTLGDNVLETEKPKIPRKIQTQITERMKALEKTRRPQTTAKILSIYAPRNNNR